MENVPSDVFQGCFVVTCTLLAFIGLVWLREQILHGGGPDWLERDNNNVPPPAADVLPPPAQPPPPENNNILEPDLQQGVNQVGESTFLSQYLRLQLKSFTFWDIMPYYPL
jgi:E3 ubiquitin-protein ligase MARCH6